MTAHPPNPDRKEETLISFLLFTYNQEAFVREAVLAALAQDYSPMEIIISDDGSRDDTFAIIEEVTASYQGPHRLLVRRNPVNLGFIAHFNEVVRISQGEWIIMAAGDDISLRERTSRVAALAEANPSSRSIFLGISPIGDVEGLREIPFCPDGIYRFPAHLQSHGAIAVGASQAWHRSILEIFGELPADLLREDALLPFRAGLVGDVVVDNTIAVLYRIGADSLSQGYFRNPSRKALLKTKAGELGEILQMEKDLAVAVSRGWVDEMVAAGVSSEIGQMKNTARVSVALLEGSRTSRLRAAFDVVSKRGAGGRICGNWRFRVGLSKLAFC
jgi:glycosyltransferase involved in cell wall biosynthesis